MNAISARFDDLTTGHSVVFREPGQQFVAMTPADVVDALAAAEAAARGGSWVAGFVAYEAAPGLDPALPVVRRAADDPLIGLPLVWFTAFAGAEAAEPLVAHPTPLAHWRLARDERGHRGDVERIRAGIAAGDYYQVNLTTRASGCVSDPLATYSRLATAQRGAYNALLTTGEHAVISASPELFVTRDRQLLTTRPMKGTAARRQSPSQDLAAAAALRASPKEQAENIMIVDLLRNDLGRIAEPGTVMVPALLELERYPTVWQLTSTVTAQARPDADDLVALFRALFPSGSVTGAPKAAAMRAIADLEPSPRGVYCGAVGYLGPHPLRPPMRFSVAIRTLTVALATDLGEYGTGGGITWSSDPASEWAELQTKTRVLDGPHHVRQTTTRDRRSRGIA
jgi:para-aminobenzoate synthetase/4-amino-4-deoxychorismate lyase